MKSESDQPVCGKKEDVEPFELWWKKHPINSTNVPQALKDSYRELAKAGWDASNENRK